MQTDLCNCLCVDGINSYVDVNFDQDTRTIICEFLNQPLDSVKECIANVTYGANCGQKLDVYGMDGTGYIVTTPPLDLPGNIAEFCFTVTARSNNVTVAVEGSNALYIYLHIVCTLTCK